MNMWDEKARLTTVETYMGIPLEELHGKAWLCRNLIVGPLQGKWAGDPRTPGCLAYYQGELDKIEEAIRRKESGDIPPVVVGLRPVRLSGKVKHG